MGAAVIRSDGRIRIHYRSFLVPRLCARPLNLFPSSTYPTCIMEGVFFITEVTLITTPADVASLNAACRCCMKWRLTTFRSKKGMSAFLSLE